MIKKLYASDLNEGDLVFSEIHKGCALISEQVHSNDSSVQCYFIWYPEEDRFWLCDSLSLNYIRKPTYEEVNEFMRHYSQMADGWRMDSIALCEMKDKIREIIGEAKDDDL